MYYPRSFLKLIIAGFLLVALPLIFAIVNNAFSIHEVVERSQRTVQQAVQATEVSRAIMEQVTAMERSIRQYVALGDEALLEGYRHARGRFLQNAQRMGTLRLDPEQSNQLKLLKQQEAELSEAVEASRWRQETLGRLLAEFAALDARAEALDDLGGTVVQREVAALQAMAEDFQRFVYWELIALVPVALSLVVGAIALIARPITQIDAAIRRLGEGDFGTPISVGGPQDLQHLGRQLEWMRLKLIDLEEQKTLFLRHVSHELKTPLASLREGTDLLDEQVVGSLSPAQREVATILKQNTQRLQHLIEDLLRYHTTQFQKTAVATEAVQLAELVTRAGQQHRLQMAAKGLRWKADCPDVVVEADREKLAAIVGNLVSNAVKFSPDGGMVRVSAVHQDDRVCIEVSDDGPGIPQDERSRVFEPFFQGSTSQRGAVKGTGLGLAIVREFVVAHGGSIEVAERAGPGTTIRVWLPAVASERKAA